MKLPEKIHRSRTTLTILMSLSLLSLLLSVHFFKKTSVFHNKYLRESVKYESIDLAKKVQWAMDDTNELDNIHAHLSGLLAWKKRNNSELTYCLISDKNGQFLANPNDLTGNTFRITEDLWSKFPKTLPRRNDYKVFFVETQNTFGNIKLLKTIVPIYKKIDFGVTCSAATPYIFGARQSPGLSEYIS